MTEYRLNQALLKGAKGASIRCPKCRERIIVENLDAPPAAPPILQRLPHTIGPPVPSIVVPPLAYRAAPRLIPPATRPVFPVSAVASNIAASPVAADISSVVLPKIEQPTSHETPVPPPNAHDLTDAAPAPSVHPIPKVSRLEDLLVFSPGKQVGRLKAPARRKPFPGRNHLVAGLSILLLAVVVLSFGTTEAGQELLGKWFPSWGLAYQLSAAERPAYEVRELKSIVHEKAVAGNLFVVGGTVVNVGKGTSHGIRMRAALLGEDNQVLMENSSLAGNVIDEPIVLRHMKPNTIDVFLQMEHREEGEQRDLLPGKSLPFMVVFIDPPEKTESFTVHAVDAK
jgi:hypothetical protein